MLAGLLIAGGPLASPWTETSARALRGPRRVRSLQLAPGVWILRTTTWVHADLLDTHAELPAPDVDEDQVRRRTWWVPDWHTWALCGGMSFAAFFGAASDERPTMKRSEVAYARSICAGCPVKRDCLDWALDNGEAFGVWGGTSGRQRGRMRAQMKAGLTQETIVEEWLARWLEM